MAAKNSKRLYTLFGSYLRFFLAGLLSLPTTLFRLSVLRNSEQKSVIQKPGLFFPCSNPLGSNPIFVELIPPWPPQFAYISIINKSDAQVMDSGIGKLIPEIFGHGMIGNDDLFQFPVIGIADRGSHHRLINLGVANCGTHFATGYPEVFKEPKMIGLWIKGR